MYILLVKDYPIGKKTKCYSLMMPQARLFKIPSAMVFLLSLLKGISCQRIRCNGWTLHFNYSQHQLDYLLQV
jgi:hypothetical protein